jgi:hypothetical protein
MPSAGAASGASTCSSPPALASPCWGSGGSRSGSVGSASGAGSLGANSPGADGSGAGVAVVGFDLRGAALADLIKQIQLSYKSKRAAYLLCNKMGTYSEDLFMTAFFTRMTRGVSASVLAAGDGATPAGGVVPATAMVTDPAAEATGYVPIS